MNSLVLLSIAFLVVGIGLMMLVHDCTSDEYGQTPWLIVLAMTFVFTAASFFFGCTFWSCREIWLNLVHDDVRVYCYMPSSGIPAELADALTQGYVVVHSEESREFRHADGGYDYFVTKYLVKDNESISDKFNKLSK